MPSPADAAAHHREGVAAVGRGDFHAGLVHLRAAVQAEPVQPTYWIALIDALIQAGHPALADDMLQQARAAGLPLYETQMLAARISVGDEPEPDELNYVIALFNERNFAQLEPVAAVMIKRYPECGVVWKLLGTARLMAGRAAEALPALQQAAVFLPADGDVLVNLANALRSQDRLAEAEACLQRALALQPQSALLHGSLGNLYRQQRRPQLAQASYLEALRLQPTLAAARQNLGVVLADQGELAQAEAQYRQALAAQPDLLDGYVNLATLLQNTGRVREAQALLAQGLAAVATGQWTLASLAITGCWLLQDRLGAQQLFQSHQAQAGTDEARREDRAAREFFWLCARLFDAMARNPQLYDAGDAAVARLVVLGESHCLPPAHMVFPWISGAARAESRLVKGVKMHHLAIGAPNGFQAALQAQLQQVPRDAHLLLAIGEIDCRADEGLWPAARKGKGVLTQLVPATVTGYLDWVARHVAPAGFASLTLQGVPVPRRTPAADHEAFLAMVAEVNAQLREGCVRRGWHFLDVHAATSQAVWHIDEFHLQPAFYARALDWLRMR